MCIPFYTCLRMWLCTYGQVHVRLYVCVCWSVGLLHMYSATVYTPPDRTGANELTLLSNSLTRQPLSSPCS